MIRAKLCFVAEGVTIDQETRQVSAFSLQETLQPQAYPAPAPRMAFFCMLEREGSDPSELSGEFIIALDGQELLRASVEVDFHGFSRNRTVLKIEGLMVPRAGDLLFRLSVPGHEAAEYVVRAQAAKAPMPAQGPVGYQSSFAAVSPTVRIGSGEVRIR